MRAHTKVLFVSALYRGRTGQIAFAVTFRSFHLTSGDLHLTDYQMTDTSKGATFFCCLFSLIFSIFLLCIYPGVFFLVPPLPPQRPGRTPEPSTRRCPGQRPRTSANSARHKRLLQRTTANGKQTKKRAHKKDRTIAGHSQHFSSDGWQRGDWYVQPISYAAKCFRIQSRPRGITREDLSFGPSNYLTAVRWTLVFCIAELRRDGINWLLFIPHCFDFNLIFFNASLVFDTTTISYEKESDLPWF